MNQKPRWFSTILIVAAVILFSRLGGASPAVAQPRGHESGESFGASLEDILESGARGRWVRYLADEWAHKNKVLDAYFAYEDTLFIVLRREARSQEVELRRSLTQSYNERVWNAQWKEGDEGGPSVSRHWRAPRYVRILIQYKG